MAQGGHAERAECGEEEVKFDRGYSALSILCINCNQIPKSAFWSASQETPSFCEAAVQQLCPFVWSTVRTFDWPYAYYASDVQPFAAA